MTQQYCFGQQSLTLAGLLDLLRFLSVLSLDRRLLGGLTVLLLLDLGGLGNLSLRGGEALQIANLGHDGKTKQCDIQKPLPVAQTRHCIPANLGKIADQWVTCQDPSVYTKVKVTQIRTIDRSLRRDRGVCMFIEGSFPGALASRRELSANNRPWRFHTSNFPTWNGSYRGLGEGSHLTRLGGLTGRLRRGENSRRE